LLFLPYAMRYLHIPLPDFSIPSIQDAMRFVSFLDEIKLSNGKVLVHCYAGCGRTGTMLAVYLVSQGMNANDAISHLRNLNGCFVETEEQEEFVRKFEKEILRNIYKEI
ncbi:MAG: dual specificity protein phosphatase family protein, partial [Thermoplasmata archaeon]